MSSLVTTCIGLVAVMFAGTGMRDPVTRISSSAGCCAKVAGCADTGDQRLTANKGRQQIARPQR
ncbi:MAG TPA: hypothetical protein VME42_11155 [Steroidobacteraceae bacterium]|nr:hypothetical protein [Steroidobacteraceae bacterium]